jgi:endonuclease III
MNHVPKKRASHRPSGHGIVQAATAKRNQPPRAGTDARLARSQLYSEELGIALARNDDREFFKWFLASILFGHRISETIARHTYEAFVLYGLLDPRRILAAGWDFLVNPVMREGGFVRYDEKTSRQVLRVCEQLLADYGGSLARLHEEARDARDLEERLQCFYGVGPVTTNIFLRELRPHWTKADPAPLPIVRDLARRLGVNLANRKRKTLFFARIEAGLIRSRHRLGQARRAGARKAT